MFSDENSVLSQYNSNKGLGVSGDTYRMCLAQVSVELSDLSLCAHVTGF